MNKKTLRLIVTYDCPRNCEGCCNKQPAFKKDKVPKLDEDLFVFLYGRTFDEVILSGGEPMLLPASHLISLINKIKWRLPLSKVIMYTAHIAGPEILDVLKVLDGLTVTLHTTDDFYAFKALATHLHYHPLHVLGKSLRLNVFKSVGKIYKGLHVVPEIWQIKEDIEWIEDCPLPNNEIIYRMS